MVADDALGDPAYDGGVALRVDALAAHRLAHPQVELVDQLGVRLVLTVERRRRHAAPLPR